MIRAPHVLTASILALGICGVGTAHAALGFNVSLGGGLWSQNPSGYIHYNSGGQQSSDVSVDNDLGLSSKTQGYAWIDIQHPFPVLPDIKIEYSGIDTSGSRVLSRSIVYGGKTYQASERVNSSLKLTQTDLIFYYQPINNVIKLRLGMDLKAMSLRADLSSASQSSSAKGSLVVPMLYAGLQADLPLTGLNIAVDGSYIGDGSDYLADYKARIDYVTDIGLGLQAGYREMALKVGSSHTNPNGDLKFKGAFAGIFYDF